ncbi:hypothetical protein TB2_033323 [Malus domestica]
MALRTLSPPTINVTMHASMPRARAYPSTAYLALSSLQQPMLVSPGSAMRWSSRVRLKSPGTENTSPITISTRRRTKWRPRVEPAEMMAEGGWKESWIMVALF